MGKPKFGSMIKTLAIFLVVFFEISLTATAASITTCRNIDNVSGIYTAKNNVTATVNVGDFPAGVAVNPDGTKVYVANWSSNNVSIIDTETNNVTATMDVGASPEGVTVSSCGKKVYVTNFASDNVSVIDTATNTVTATVDVGNVLKELQSDRMEQRYM